MTSSLRRSSSSSLLGGEPSFSATSTPAHSPDSSHLDDRLNALLASFEMGTHAFCRALRPDEAAKLLQPTSTGLPVAAAAAAAASGSSTPTPASTPGPVQQQQQQQQQTQRRPLLSLLSLTRPGILNEPTRHFDPSREPKLHGLP